MRIEQIPRFLEGGWIRIHLIDGFDFSAYLIRRHEDFLLVRNREHKFKVGLPNILTINRTPQKVQSCIKCGNIMYYKRTRYKKCTVCSEKLPRTWLSPQEVANRILSSYFDPA